MTDRLKVAIIAGASHALKYKERNPHATEAEIIHLVNKEIDSILENID